MGQKCNAIILRKADSFRFCGCEVRYVSPCNHGNNKWTVHFAWHGDKRDKFKKEMYTNLMWVQAKEFVFLGAGTLGTTEILLRSRTNGLNLSDRLGTHMSGNGDILAFGYNGKNVANAIGTDDANYLADHPVGPTITGIIDMRDEKVAKNVLDGYVIEEGAAPKALAHFLQIMYNLTPGKEAPRGICLLKQLAQLASRATSAFDPWYQGGSLNRTMIYLIMSHDDNQATLTLKNDIPSLNFDGVGRSDRVLKLNRLLAKGANKIEAEFIPNPLSSREFGKSEITVHPIGGANMSSDGTGISGVTDHFGQVFKGNSGDVYDGLVVVDGAVIPSALGVNPFATITAFAERSVRGVAKAKGLTIDYSLRNGE
jgi:choline dehydrogenase-like flavoprotein